jgi:hypothetical protein
MASPTSGCSTPRPTWPHVSAHPTPAPPAAPSHCSAACDVQTQLVVPSQPKCRLYLVRKSVLLFDRWSVQAEYRCSLLFQGVDELCQATRRSRRERRSWHVVRHLLAGSSTNATQSEVISQLVCRGSEQRETATETETARDLEREGGREAEALAFTMLAFARCIGQRR